jgi:hypothetical protein
MKTTKQILALEKEWVETIYDKSQEIDPGGEIDWCNMAYGWALGKGMSIEEASSFANNAPQ